MPKRQLQNLVMPSKALCVCVYVLHVLTAASTQLYTRLKDTAVMCIKSLLGCGLCTVVQYTHV